MQTNSHLYLYPSLYTSVVYQGFKASTGKSGSTPLKSGVDFPHSLVAAAQRWFRKATDDDDDGVRFGNAESEDLTLPAGPHSTFNKEAKKEPLNNIDSQCPQP